MNDKLTPIGMFSRMLVLVSINHEGQFDKAGAPYLLHVLQVMNNLNTEDLELKCIGLGHDLIEDTKVAFRDLRNEGFSDRVIDGIRCMTKQLGQTPEEYLEIIKSNKDAVKVKIADLIHNSDIRRLKGLTEKDFDRMRKYQSMYVELTKFLKENNEFS